MMICQSRVLMAVLMGRIRMMSSRQGMQILKALEQIPQQMETVLALDNEIKRVALKYAHAEDFFFLGRLQPLLHLKLTHQDQCAPPVYPG